MLSVVTNSGTTRVKMGRGSSLARARPPGGPLDKRAEHESPPFFMRSAHLIIRDIRVVTPD
jgi:hypothetical protein